MKLTITLFFALFLCSFSLFAQSVYGIKGSVVDTASETAKLTNTTICVLNAKDSTLVKFTRSLPNGTFAITGLRKGKFILMVTYPDYADYIEHFALDSVKTEKNFGKLNLKLKSRLLKEIMIKGAAAIKIKGDTTEFNASSFVVQPNAKVEDLLKQLPGIQVDKDGKITAQGQTVSKVLVDGEEFFGDDPTLVTKNLRADMVDKVQLYDKKSDQATFTGIDDGQKSKTINLKLKEDKKNGYFGKLDAGVGTDKFYQGQAAVNIFKARQKLSVYGIGANTGKIGLGWDDNSKYGASNNLSFEDDGSVSFTGGGRDELDSYDGTYGGQGIPVARTGGIHYDAKWDADKQSINTSYKIGYLEVNGVSNTLTQNNVPGSLQNSNSDQSFKNSMFRQKLDATYTLKIDSLTNLKISVDGTIKHSETNNNYSSSTHRNFDTLLNQSVRNVNNISDVKALNASIFYNKKFLKKGRSFSWNVSETYNQNKTDGFLNSDIDFYNSKTALKDSTQVIDQHKLSDVTTSVLNSNITYSEPFTKEIAVILNYGTGFNNSSADRRSFDRSSTGTYDKLNLPLSNDYQFNQLSNQLGAMFSYKKGKTILNFGSKATDVTFTQTDEFTGKDFKRSFLNWNPQANYQYKFSQRQALYVAYSGSTTQPTIDQIQPVLTNTDPLNITIGNPDLKPSFRNRFSFNYNSYKVLTGRAIYVSGSFSFVNNPIVSNTVTDTAGKTTYMSSNLSSKHPINFSLYGNFDRKIKPFDINLGLNVGVNGSTTYNYSNNALNTTQSYNYTSGLSLSKYQEKKFDMYISIGPRYTVSSSSLQPDINNNGLGLQGYSFFNFYLPGKLEFNGSGDYSYTPKTKSFDEDQSKIIVNSTISKKFLKEDNLKFSLSVNDLFNQNIGFSRSTYSSTITQNTYTSIRRYFMFSITYDFSKMGAAPAKK